MADKHTEEKTSIRFARILVEVEIGQTIPDCIYFNNEREGPD